MNDLLLATLDIAIDRYLQEYGARPGKALVAAMPVALADARGGNQIAVLQFPLGTPGKSPAARLADDPDADGEGQGRHAAGDARDRHAVHDARARAPGAAGEDRR